MTTATTEGRRLVLTVSEGIEFRVDPLAGRRGKELTELFVHATKGNLSKVASESMFIEALGAANYSAATGLIVERYRDDDDGNDVLTDQWFGREHRQLDATPTRRTVVFVAREPGADDPAWEVLPLRQEEIESLTLCAFYWQTVVGMEAVRAFIESGEGVAGVSKAAALYVTRGLFSPAGTSSSAVSELLTTAASSSPAPTIASSSGTVRLPAVRRPQDRRPKAKGKKAAAPK